jgi:hypothetical protein
MAAMLFLKVGWTFFHKTKPQKAKKMFGDRRNQHIFKGGGFVFTKENQDK